jgi:hypothetical protein
MPKLIDEAEKSGVSRRHGVNIGRWSDRDVRGRQRAGLGVYAGMRGGQPSSLLCRTSALGPLRRATHSAQRVHSDCLFRRASPRGTLRLAVFEEDFPSFHRSHRAGLTACSKIAPFVDADATDYTIVSDVDLLSATHPIFSAPIGSGRLPTNHCNPPDFIFKRILAASGLNRPSPNPDSTNLF